MLLIVEPGVYVFGIYILMDNFCKTSTKINLYLFTTNGGINNPWCYFGRNELCSLGFRKAVISE